MSISRLNILLAASMLAACGTQLQRPERPEINGAAGFSIDYPAVSEAAAGRNRWWTGLATASLQATLDAALATNPDIRLAMADLDAARARLRQAESDRGPRLDARAAADVQRSAGDTSNSRSLLLDGELPIDINGALARRTEAARYELELAQDELNRTRSDTARDYLLAAIDASEYALRLSLLGEQIEIAETLLRLIELRFTQGLASGVDVLQQRDQLAALRQQVPVTRYSLTEASNRLRRLAGRTPDQATAGAADALPNVRDTFAQVTPVDLLQRRPALRIARARLQAADARFAAALADQWPSLALDGSTLTRAASGDLTTLISAAVNAALTLFDAGARQAVAAERQAQLRRAGEAYLADWLGVVIDADNLLHEEIRLQERIALSDSRLETAQALLRATQRRYERGVSDYLPVLEALRGLQQQQRDHLALQASLARTRVRVHHALGDTGEGAGA